MLKTGIQLGAYVFLQTNKSGNSSCLARVYIVWRNDDFLIAASVYKSFIGAVHELENIDYCKSSSFASINQVK
jgi:hypothetical protein